jgi:pimeloyl-ACP methyl ester carboxylesterase
MRTTTKHRSRRDHALTAVAFAAVVLAAACSTGASGGSPSSTAVGQGSPKPVRAVLSPLPRRTPAALRPYYRQKLRWHECGAPGFDCATMKVPLDYAKPGTGHDVSIAVSRRKAAGGGGSRIGSLLVNPGGPGGSAVDYLQQAAALGYPAQVRERYDMVAFDPRGVGGSQPVRCLTDGAMDRYAGTDTTPDTPAEVRQVVAEDKAFARGCARRSKAMLGHVSTIEAARDMDVLRALLGDAKLHYVGLSYGTFLGATYAGLYPDRVGRLVLDGAMDPTVDAREAARAQAGGFETAFDSFARDCAKRRNCPFGTRSPRAAGAALDRLFKRLDAKPLRTDDGHRTLDEALGTTAVMSAMYDQSFWPVLRQALTAAQHGDGSDLLRLSDLYYEREDGRYSNLMYANAAVNCLDLPAAVRSPREVRAALPAFRRTSPHFGTTMAWATLGCAYWPTKPTSEPHRIEAKGAPPIVVVGTTRDPATPYAWARSLAHQLSSATLLTYEGDGHTAYTRGSTCIDNTINTYLLTGHAPHNGKHCH